MEPGEHSISVFASVELVQLDASAVYSLLSALNRPEISSVLNDLQQQAKVIQEHISEVTGEAPLSAAVTAAAKPSALAYAVHLTFAGLEVFGNSPLKSETAPLAHMGFPTKWNNTALCCLSPRSTSICAASPLRSNGALLRT
jgi:hypothetical protein